MPRRCTHLSPPFSTLYDALSPEQKKLADQSFREFPAGRGGRARSADCCGAGVAAL